MATTGHKEGLGGSCPEIVCRGVSYLYEKMEFARAITAIFVVELLMAPALCAAFMCVLASKYVVESCHCAASWFSI